MNPILFLTEYEKESIEMDGVIRYVKLDQRAVKHRSMVAPLRQPWEIRIHGGRERRWIYQ